MKRYTWIVAIGVMAWASHAAAVTFSGRAVQDLWDYDNAIDPGGDTAIRVFGDGTTDSRISTGDQKFDLTPVFLGGQQYELTSARLTVWHYARTTPPTSLNALPIKARNLSPYLSDGVTLWTEANYNAAQRPAVDFSSSLAEGDLSASAPNTIFAISFELDVSKIDFQSAVDLGVLALALQTDQPAAQPPNPSILYRYYSREGSQAFFGDDRYAPLLELEATVVPEPTTVTLVGAALGLLTVLIRRKA